jgi:hypothetical protein
MPGITLSVTVQHRTELFEWLKQIHLERFEDKESLFVFHINIAGLLFD